MDAEPRQEHRWLDRLVGEWASEMECKMGPDQPPMHSRGSEVVRSLGGLWVVAEGEGELPGGGSMTSLMTLGFDPRLGRYLGTFVASMMTHLWAYQGAVAADTLTLDTEGPSLIGEGMAKYQDSIEFVDDDHRIMRSRFRGDDGEWHLFMTAHYRRKK